MYKQIISEQRYTINVLLQKKMSKKDIAKAINVDLSTIYRELKRNSGSLTITTGKQQKPMPAAKSAELQAIVASPKK